MSVQYDFCCQPGAKQIRKKLVEFKKNRRVSIGPYATFYFENFETVVGQIQEMLHIEGRKTSFIAPTPNELKIPNAENMNPTISERNLKY